MRQHDDDILQRVSRVPVPAVSAGMRGVRRTHQGVDGRGVRRVASLGRRHLGCIDLGGLGHDHRFDVGGIAAGLTPHEGVLAVGADRQELFAG